MVRTPSCDKNGLKKGTWTPEEDSKLTAYVTRYGCWNWRQLPKFAGLARCGKSCRLRWLNYLRPNIKRGNYTQEEEGIIIKLHEKLGNKWSVISSHLPGRTDNEIKNHWNTTLKKRFGKNAVVNENVEAAKSNDSESTKQEGDLVQVQSKGFLHGSPWTSSATNENLLEALNENNVWTESYLADFSNTPVDQIVPDIVQGSDTNETLNNAWALSPQSLSSESLVVENDHYAFLEEATEPITEIFWTEPYVADLSHVPNELLASLVTESDEYFTPGFDADLWSDTRDLHISHSNE